MSRVFTTQQRCQPVEGGIAVSRHRSVRIRGVSGVATRHRSVCNRRAFGVAVSCVSGESSVVGRWQLSRFAARPGDPLVQRHLKLQSRVGGVLEHGSIHQPASSSNKRVKFVPFGHPTRKVLRTLLAAYARRYTRDIG